MLAKKLLKRIVLERFILGLVCLMFGIAIGLGLKTDKVGTPNCSRTMYSQSNCTTEDERIFELENALEEKEQIDVETEQFKDDQAGRIEELEDLVKWANSEIETCETNRQNALDSLSTYDRSRDTEDNYLNVIIAMSYLDHVCETQNY